VTHLRKIMLEELQRRSYRNYTRLYRAPSSGSHDRKRLGSDTDHRPGPRAPRCFRSRLATIRPESFKNGSRASFRGRTLWDAILRIQTN
jgi:hypothetical protein